MRTLIRGARQLLTLRGSGGPRRGADLGNLGIIQDGAVLVADGLIVEVGPSRRLENLALARGATEIDASGSVVAPGFVDSDVRLVKRAAPELSPRALRSLALREVEEAVRCGTTAMRTKSGDLKILRMHAALRELALTFVSAFDADGLPLEASERLLQTVRQRRIAEFATETMATLSPALAFHAEAERHPSARSLVDSGAAVALATAGHCANMQMAIALACCFMGMTAEQAICASTINGAYAIGRAQTVGSIEAGKSADLAILGVPDYRELPEHLGVNLATLVMIRGTVRVERPEVKWPIK